MNTLEKQRFWLVELLAWWEGRVNTSDLVREFQISRQSASKSINLYLTLQSDSLTYNTHQKVYQPTEAFTPLAAFEVYLNWNRCQIKPAKMTISGIP